MKPLTLSLPLAAVALLLATATNAEAREVRWGEPGDVPVPADFDGDGKADIAIWRPSTGMWWIVQSTTNTQRVVQWGEPGDVPVTADFDGDGKADTSIYRPSTGTWWIVQSMTNTGRTVRWGEPGDVVAPADFDGDNKADVAIFRPSDGTWWVVQSATGTHRVAQWGLAGDIPLPANYDAYPGADFAVYRPSNRTFYTHGSSPQGTANSMVRGAAGDVPLAITGCYGPDVTYLSPTTFVWSIYGQGGPVQWGAPGDIPVPASYNGWGVASKAVFRPSTGRWYIYDAPYTDVCIN